MRKLVFAIMASGLLAGCATGGIKYADMTAATAPRLKSGQGRIYFYRTSAMGFAVQPDIKLNGVTVGSATPNGFFFVDRPPGTYEITATTEVEEKIHITLRPGETQYVQFYLTPGIMVGHANLNPVSKEKAEREMADLSQTGTH
jgi:Protein of unknown function (DUF2846)